MKKTNLTSAIGALLLATSLSTMSAYAQMAPPPPVNQTPAQTSTTYAPPTVPTAPMPTSTPVLNIPPPPPGPMPPPSTMLLCTCGCNYQGGIANVTSFIKEGNGDNDCYPIPGQVNQCKMWWSDGDGKPPQQVTGALNCKSEKLQVW